MPAPELAPGSVVTADLSITVQEDDRSDRSNSPLSSTNEPGAQCDTSFKEESGENTALLGKQPADYKTNSCYRLLKENKYITCRKKQK